MKQELERLTISKGKFHRADGTIVDVVSLRLELIRGHYASNSLWPENVKKEAPRNANAYVASESRPNHSSELGQKYDTAVLYVRIRDKPRR